MMALSEHPKSREVNTPPVSGLADPALPLGGYRIRGCGVVVAQEPSKLLGPVRVWSAAPLDHDFIAIVDFFFNS